MNENNEPESENDVSVLFKFYTRRVFSKLKRPENPKQKPDRHQKNREE
jgi:hypothetical protein